MENLGIVFISREELAKLLLEVVRSLKSPFFGTVREARQMNFLANNECSEALGGREIALKLREVKGDRAAGSRQRVGTDMSTASEEISTSLEEILGRIERLLLQTWQETGFGSLTIESERIKNKKIRVIIKGGTHFRYVIFDEDVVRWVSRKSSQKD